MFCIFLCCAEPSQTLAQPRLNPAWTLRTQALFVLAREDEDGEEEDELHMQPEWEGALAGFPAPEGSPDGGDGDSDGWETDEGLGEVMHVEVRLTEW